MYISYGLEIVGMFLAPLFTVLIFIYIGQFYGIYHAKKFPELPHNAVGALVGTVFGLLAFLLAFTFQIASNHYDARKELLMEEASNIRTAYLQTGLLKEPVRSDSRKLLIEYVDLRTGLAKDQDSFKFVITRSQQILNKLWNYAEEMNEQDRSLQEFVLYSSAISTLIDSYNKRLTVVVAYRIPESVLFVLYCISILSMLAFGYQFGISGKGSFKINLLLGIIFALVIFLILALDRPETRLAKIDQKPMIILHDQLHGKQVH
jgi:ABC-type multidrug transport system fused ATPase/permease subunit